MVYKIIWSSLAIQTYAGNISYLEKEWSKKEVNNFIRATERKLALLKIFPALGYSSKKKPNLKNTLIGKRIILIYRINPKKNSIELIRFFNSWQDPSKIKL